MAADKPTAGDYAKSLERLEKAIENHLADTKVDLVIPPCVDTSQDEDDNDARDHTESPPVQN